MSVVSLIIPAFNEEQGVAAVIARAKQLPLEVEIIVVDDGSTDGTAEAAERAGARVLKHPANGGYGQAIKTGIQAASHDLIAIADADGTYPVERLPELIAKVEGGFAMAVGARRGREYRGTFLKMPARLLFQFLVEFSTGKRIPDINSGLRVFRKSEVTPLLPQLCNVYSFTTTLTLAYCFLQKFICYVPIAYGKRVGTSKVRIVRDSLRTLQFIVESIAAFNPLKLFLLLALTLALAGFLLLGWALLLPHWLLWLLAGQCFVAGAIVFALGILADVHRTLRRTP